MLFVIVKQRIYAPKFAPENVSDSHCSKKSYAHMHVTGLSQMLFHLQVITSYCHFCNKIVCPCLLSPKLPCSSFVVLTENEAVSSRSPSSLPRCTFPTEHDTKKNPDKLPPLFCRMYKTSCFYKLLHQVCSSDSLRTIWAEALEIQVDFKTVRRVNRVYIESPQNFEWNCNLEPLLFLQASWSRQEWNLRNLLHKSFINSETWFVSKK